MSDEVILPAGRLVEHSDGVDEEEGIYRGEVRAIMVALADIHAKADAILAALTDDEDDDEAEAMDS